MVKRVQLKRQKGWRMPPATAKVDRSTRWGNPYHQDDYDGRSGAVAAYEKWIRGDSTEARALRAAARTELKGLNLACWCPLDGPCHADTLLEIANDR